jgi:hypothetical protein
MRRSGHGHGRQCLDQLAVSLRPDRQRGREQDQPRQVHLLEQGSIAAARVPP